MGTLQEEPLSGSRAAAMRVSREEIFHGCTSSLGHFGVRYVAVLPRPASPKKGRKCEVGGIGIVAARRPLALHVDDDTHYIHTTLTMIPAGLEFDRDAHNPAKEAELERESAVVIVARKADRRVASRGSRVALRLWPSRRGVRPASWLSAPR